jgi:sulfur-oxidizing protein SoxY
MELGSIRTRREVLSLLGLGGLAIGAPAGLTAQPRPGAGDAAHRISVDAPILADDPVAVPLTIAVDHPMERDHYILSLEVELATDPVPGKGVFRFTPESGRASVAYQIRSGQGGDLRVRAECSRHGRFEVTHALRVAPGGCAVPPAATTRERGGSPTVRVDGRARPGQVVPVWASLKHTSHTGLVERQGKVFPERPPFFVERLAVFVGEQQVSEFLMTPAVSADPKLRFFVRAAPGKAVRVVFVNNKGERWEASQPIG